MQTSCEQKDLMEQQQHGFSDSTPGEGSERLQNQQKVFLVQLISISVSQISTQKYGSGHFDRKNSSNKRTSKESF